MQAELHWGVTSTIPLPWNGGQGWFRWGPQVEVCTMAAPLTTPAVLVKPTASWWQSWHEFVAEDPPW